MSVLIGTIAIGGWYPRGVARMIEQFRAASPGFELCSWVNTVPFAAPRSVIVQGYDYTAYCAKPFALAEMAQRADIVILLDAAFYPIRPIHSLIEHIQRVGYYFCRNGYAMGEWCSDAALAPLGLRRDQAMGVEEISSYCVGLNMHDLRCHELLRRWTELSRAEGPVPGPHTNSAYHTHSTVDCGRNPGFVSSDPRVKGHRHDQTVLSALAYHIGMNQLVNRPRFTAYLGSETEETVLVNQGMGS